MRSHSTVAIANNTFDGNQATIGGGVYLYSCDGSVSGNVIANNTASVGGSASPAGAGIALENCTGVALSSNSLDNNTGAQYGGGYWIRNSTGISINGDVASNNTAAFGGAGAYFSQSTVTASDTRFATNVATIIGGALAADTSTVTVTECEFVDNTATIGAGPYVNGGEAYFRHNLMASNVASSTGGGLYVSALTAGEILGNTLDGNGGNAGVGGLFVINTGIEVFNNIISNSTGHGFGCSGTPPANTYNLVWASTGNDYDACAPGTGAVIADPRFKDAGAEDYRLTLNSPAIDGGRPGAPYDDPDGSRGDMGRYGSHAFAMAQPSYPKDLLATFASGNVTLSWTPNPEGDIDYYAIYCDSVGSFAPGANNLVTTTADSTVNLGAPADTAYYKISAVDLDGYASGYSNESSSEPPITTAIGNGIRYPTSLGQNLPNPFNPATTIRFSLAKRVAVELVVFDVAGRRIRTLLRGPRSAGPHETSWDGRNDGGMPVASGVYFYRLQAGAFSQTRKMLFLK